MVESKEKKEKKDKSASFKHWVTRIVCLIVILTFFMYAFQVYFDIPVFVDTLVAVTIVMSMGFTHEALHYYQAVKLGYKPKWYRTKLMMGFEISHKSARGKWLKDKKKIALLPYVVLVPISLCLLGFGIYLESLSLSIAGLCGIVLHAISYPFEGKSA